MQVDRRFKWAATVVLVLAGLHIPTSWAQTTTLRPPVSNFGSTGTLGTANAPASSPANGQMTSTPHSVPNVLQAPQAPLSAPQTFQPRGYGATPAQTAQPPQVNKIEVGKRHEVKQIKLPQRTQCLPGILGMAVGKGGTTVTLVCNVPDLLANMEFHIKDDQQLKTLEAADKSGFSLRIDYEDETPGAEGSPSRRLVMVGAQEAYQSRVHVVCLPVSTRNQLNVGPRNGEPYPQITTFCTDGQRVTPVTFAPDKTSWSLLNSAVEDGPLSVDYHLVMGGPQAKTGVVRPYPVHRISKLPQFPPAGIWASNAQHPGDPALAGMATRCAPSNLSGAGAAGCVGTTLRVKVIGGLNATEYRAFFTDAIVRAQNQPVPEGYTKSVNYTLMPGVVPAELRNATQGACRVALHTAVEVKKNKGWVGIAIGRPDHPKDAYCRKLFGNSTAIWGSSPLRNEYMCFPSREALKAEENEYWARQQQARGPYEPPPPPSYIPDTCQLLPR